jgi:ribosomal protein L22
MMAGRYPVKPVKYFIIMLKNLRANAIVNGMEEGTIVEAIPNRASRPYGRFGSVKRKRTHVKIKIKEKKK